MSLLDKNLRQAEVMRLTNHLNPCVLSAVAGGISFIATLKAVQRNIFFPQINQKMPLFI